MPSDSTDPRSETGRTRTERPPSRLLLVELGGTLCGLDAEHVREIVGLLPVTRLPGAPPHVKGVVNLRGQLLTVVDLRQRLAGEPMTNPDGSTLVVQAEERLLGVLVNDVRDVTLIDVVPSDQASVADAAGLVAGLGRLDDEVVLVIDVPELVRQTLA
ncbi:MAG TPA: chemotaxis protein CheW [Gemmatimonadaceae bacterium]